MSSEEKKLIIEKIFCSNLKAVTKANFFVTSLLKNLSHLKSEKESLFKIYNTELKDFVFFDEKDIYFIDLFLKSCYDEKWKDDVKFDFEWVSELEKEILRVITESAELQKFVFFFF